MVWAVPFVLSFEMHSGVCRPQPDITSPMSPKSFLRMPGLACAAFLLALAHPVISAAEEAWVGVAYYSPRAEYEADAKRVSAILQEHHIRSVTTASASAQINVSSRQAAEARKLIAAAIKKEKLRVTLVK